MPFFADGQDPRDTPGTPAPERAPLGSAAPDPFAPQPGLAETTAAAFRQNNPIVSVVDAIANRSDDSKPDPTHNPLDMAKGTPLEQDPSALLDSPNAATTQAIIAQRQREDSDRQTLAQGGWTGTIASLGAGLIDPSYYLPIFGELHAAEGAASFGRSALRAAATGAGQSAASETALGLSQQRRSFAESAGNIATNTLLMGALGGALGVLARPERAAAVDAMEAVRRDSTPVDPLDPSSMSLQDHITPGDSGFSQGLEKRAEDLRAAGVAASPIEAAEAAHIEALPPEIAHEVDGGTAQAGIRDAAERGGQGGEPDPAGALGEPSGGWGADGGGSLGLDPAAANERLAAAGGDGDAVGLADRAQDEVLAKLRERTAPEPWTPPEAPGIRDDDTPLSVYNDATGGRAEARSVTSLSDALSQFDISGDVNADPLARSSSLAIGEQIKRMVGDVPVYTVDGDGMETLSRGRVKGGEAEGFYDPAQKHIVLRDDAIKDPAAAAHLVLHEGLHAAFQRTIEHSDGARGLIDQLREFASAHHVANGGNLDDHYGLSANRAIRSERDRTVAAHEFVSEAFSSPSFQRFLSTIPISAEFARAFGMSSRASLWDAFTGAVRRILGFSEGQHSALDAAMALGPLLERERAKIDPSFQASSEPLASVGERPVGADVSDTRDLTPKSYGLNTTRGIRKVANAVSPNQRIYNNSESITARRAQADLAETATRFTMHDRGVPTSAGGAPIETLVRQDKARFMATTHDILERAWSDHRYGDQKPGMVQQAADRVQEMRGNTPAGKLTYKDFKGQVYDAMTAGDQHPIAQVQQAARDMRAKVFDPIAKMAQETLGPDGKPMLGEALSPPAGDQSFAPRAWNKEAVIPKRYQLKQIITDWLDREQRTKAAQQERIGGFVDDLKAAGERADELRADIERNPPLDASRDARANLLDQEIAKSEAIRKKIEKEIGDWQGSTTAEAKSAIARRAEAERARQERIDEGSYKGGEPKRLTTADAAVDAATRKILASDRDLSRQELASRADEVIDRIIGSPDGRIPYDAASGGPDIGFTGGPKQEVRGSLKSRDFAIPTPLVKDFIHRDLEHVTSSFVRTMLPDIQLTRRFGDVDMTNTFRKIQEDYARKIGPETSEAEATRLNAQRDADIRDIAAVRDRNRGVYGWNPDPSARKVGAIVRDFQNASALASLGTSVANRLNDIGAQAVFRYGIQNVFNDAWRPFFKSMLGMSPVAGIAKAQAREMGIGIDGLLGHLRHDVHDINDSYMPGNKFSRGLAWATDRSMEVNLHGPWTDWMKAMAWVPAQAEFGRVADRIAAGTHTARDLSTMADANISPALAARISAQFAQHSITVDGVRMADAGKWTDPQARDAFERAMSREANINVITAGVGDKPLFLSKPLGGLLGQFKGFVAGAHERILISNMQQRDGRTMQGMLVAMSMGMLSYRLYTLLSGQQASERPQDWVKEGLARSAMTGWFNEANSTLAKFTAGKVDYNRLYGADRPLSRRTENSPLSELLGPTYARLEGLTGIGVHVLGGHASAADIHQARMALPLQNLMGARILFDQAEDGISNSLGMKPRSHTPNQWAPGPTPYPGAVQPGA